MNQIKQIGWQLIFLSAIAILVLSILPKNSELLQVVIGGMR